MTALPKVRVYVPAGVDPDESGRRSRRVARALAKGKALPGMIVDRLADRQEDMAVLATGKIKAAGTDGLQVIETGEARAFLVGHPRDCMIGQLLAASQPVRKGHIATLSPFSVNPDPEGIDG